MRSQFEGGDEMSEVLEPGAVAGGGVCQGVGRGDAVAGCGKFLECFGRPGYHRCESKDAIYILA